MQVKTITVEDSEPVIDYVTEVDMFIQVTLSNGLELRISEADNDGCLVIGSDNDTLILEPRAANMVYVWGRRHQ